MNQLSVSRYVVNNTAHVWHYKSTFIEGRSVTPQPPPSPPPPGARRAHAVARPAIEDIIGHVDSSLSIHAYMADHSSIPFRSILTPRYCKPDSLGMPNLGVTDGCMDDVVDQPVVSCSLIIRIGERKRLSVFLYLPIPVDLDHVMQLSE